MVLSLGLPTAGSAETGVERHIAAALVNIATLPRPDKDGIATFADGNKYVQCWWMADRSLHCEAAGFLMQPSLARVLTPERVATLDALGWRDESSFGNYVREFQADVDTGKAAAEIRAVLDEVYAAELDRLYVRTNWIESEPCPPRKASRQYLAGSVSDSREVAASLVRTCSYEPQAGDGPPPPLRNKAEILDLYAAKVTGEIQRLRVNVLRGDSQSVMLDTDAGYILCFPDPAVGTISCEAQSAESCPVLSRILTPEREAILQAAGFAEPGRWQNYSRDYPLAEFTDAAIAEALLGVLCDAYGYNGLPELKVQTESGPV